MQDGYSTMAVWADTHKTLKQLALDEGVPITKLVARLVGDYQKAKAAKHCK